MSSSVHYSNDTQNLPLPGSDYDLHYLKLEEEDDADDAEDMERLKDEQRDFDNNRKTSPNSEENK